MWSASSSFETEAVFTVAVPDVMLYELAEKLRARQPHTQGIADAAAGRRFAPGELSRLREGSKLVRHWLK
jgi:hypothetical protein